MSASIDPVQKPSKAIHEFPKAIGSPATRALLEANITTLRQIAEKSDAELLSLHGFGQKALRILREQIKIGLSL